MTTQAPSLRAIAAIAAFALSCFGFLLFIWLSFGGAIPLMPKGYRVSVPFPEAAGLVAPVDVRVAGVPVGSVAETRRDPAGNRTIGTIELDEEYAPIHEGARFILRQKTLLGETYVEMAPGPASAATVREGATLRRKGTVGEVTQLDELLNSFDPGTREAFQTWQQDFGRGIGDVGLTLNAALGHLTGFVQEGADLTAVLDAQSGALERIVRNGGATFEALSRDVGQLRALARNQEAVFSAIARESESFAQLFAILPTFLAESRLTLERLERFARDTDPLVVRLTPALVRLRPTLQDLGGLAPDLERLFADLDPYIPLARRSFPATREVLDATRPTLAALHPLLSELNPILTWIGFNMHQLTDFLNNLAAVNAAKGYPSEDPQSPGHLTRQFSPTGPESQALWPTRRPSNRGNAYLPPLWQADPQIGRTGILPAFDCRNTGGEQPATATEPPCRVARTIEDPGLTGRFPRLPRRDYRR